VKWWAVLNIALLTAAIVLPVVALVYAVRALRWGFRHYPKSSGAIAVLLVVGLVVVVPRIQRFFPTCEFAPGYGVRCHRAG
jgi:hypothetical protein